MKTKFEKKWGMQAYFEGGMSVWGVIQPQREEKVEERLGESRNDTV